jgi:hypothetical protein
MFNQDHETARVRPQYAAEDDEKIRGVEDADDLADEEDDEFDDDDEDLDDDEEEDAEGAV